ncbi:hypothetical protein CPB83DRAFT_862639 [Crepidotus variabilis]|uniref:Uncharacterized protein n=1 Tax=Crepidotus variabilis TaxID=179855 RepID=A0A9P6E6W4_9AGAR|nr:hypothetical protein CPB83DRAFT_862639 [Crepidotus variabilis]
MGRMPLCRRQSVTVKIVFTIAFNIYPSIIFQLSPLFKLSLTCFTPFLQSTSLVVWCRKQNQQPWSDYPLHVTGGKIL